jgi:hypothetical protein
MFTTVSATSTVSPALRVTMLANGAGPDVMARVGRQLSTWAFELSS